MVENYYRSRTRAGDNSFIDGFFVSPLPYPVLLILGVILALLGLQWYVSFEETVEATEEGFGWILFATPVVLLLLARWLSNCEDSFRWIFSPSPYERCRRAKYWQHDSEGSSPWGVAALILLLLLLMQFQSSFLEGWFI